MTALLEELERLAADVEIHSRTSFSFRARRIEGEGGDGDAAGTDTLSPRTREMLERLLYSALHVREPVLEGVPSIALDWNGAQAFIDRLSSANQGTGTWQSGWRVHGVAADGRIVAEKYGLKFRVRPGNFRPPGKRATARQSGYVRIGREFRELVPGFYMALGNADDEDDTSAECLRVYWHLRADGAVPLTSRLTTRLNDAGIPFRFKVVSDPLRFRRTDAAVLYIAPAHVNAAWPILKALSGGIREFLRPEVSAFVKRLAPGIGLAEDPRDGSSFGQHRCRVLVAALASPAFAAAQGVAARRDVVVRGIRDAGLNERAFHLQPESVDRFPAFT
jgi:hypothetical protein